MRTHIKTVAIVNIIFSALQLLKAIGFLVGGVLGGLFSGSVVGFISGTTTGIFGGVIGGAFGVFGLIAGFGLLNHKSWARTVAIIVAIFSLLNFPFGTLFAVYTLWVLFNDETKRIFALGPVATSL